MNLGKINIKSKYTAVDWIRGLVGLRKSISLNIRPYSGKTTLEICKLVNSGNVLKSEDTKEIMSVLETNLPGYIDLILTACDIPKQTRGIAANGISESWTIEEILEATKHVYKNVDFQSAVEIMSIMGQIRFDD